MEKIESQVKLEVEKRNDSDISKRYQAYYAAAKKLRKQEDK